MAQVPYVSARSIFYRAVDVPESAGYKARRKSWDESTEFPVIRIIIAGYAGMASLGYKSGYQHRDARWLEITLLGQGSARKRFCWRFTGPKADAKYQELLASNLDGLNKRLASVESVPA